MKIIMNTDGTISFEEEERPVLDSIDFNYKETDIKQSLIEECEELSIKNNKTYFIFDDMVSNRIEVNNNITTEMTRNEKLNLLLDEEDSYHIGTEDDFRGLPSRYSYYDTETKLIGRYRRYDFVTTYLSKIGFTPVITNLGTEYEQSYLIELVDEKFICRLRPNLFLKIIYQNSYFSDCEQKTIFEGFFKKTEIFEIMKSVAGTSFARDLKLSQILE
jgi:hypothetical protein